MEQIVYIEFYLAGDCIFACKESWFQSQMDIEIQKGLLADSLGVERGMIKTGMRIVELPIIVPKGFMNELLGDNNISFSE